MLCNIEISIKGDHEWGPDEQEYHENRIGHFEYYLDKSVLKTGLKMGIPVFINCYYLPADRSFLIYKISKAQDRVSGQILGDPTLKSYKIKVDLRAT